jgi:hypothetical protein
MEQTQNPQEYEVVYLPSSNDPPRVVKVRDLIVGSMELVYAETVVYHPESTLQSYPTHVRGLFMATARLKSELVSDEPPTMNLFISRVFKKRFRGHVVAAYCVVPVSADIQVINADINLHVTQDLSIERLSKLENDSKLRSPGFDFIEHELHVSPHYCRLDQYLRPFPIPTPDEKWNHPKWAPKQAVNELFVQLKLKPFYVEAGAKELGEDLFKHTRDAKKFYMKLETRHTDEDGVEHIDPIAHFSQNGPFSTKYESEVAAAVTYLVDYHDAVIQARNPDLYRLGQKLLGESSVEPESDDVDGGGSKPGSSEVDGDSSVPLDIKKPTIGIWERISSVSCIDLFGNGCLIKSVLEEGKGPFLGVTCCVRAWIAVLTEQDDGIYGLMISKLESLVVGAEHPQIPIAALASMRVGESAYFWLHPNIVRNADDPLLEDNSKGFILAICIPPHADIQYLSEAITHSKVNTPLEQRVQHCDECNKDAVALYKQRHYKLALDHYQLGLAELFTSNKLFVDRSRALRTDIQWNESLQAFRDEFIRNRLGVIACCIYIQDREWPHHAPNWKAGKNPLEEGLDACEAILRLEPQHFLAHRRKALLLIRANRFEEAQIQLEITEKLDLAHTEENRKVLQDAKDDLARRIKRSTQEAATISKRMFQN